MTEGVDSSKWITIRMMDEEWEASHCVVWCLVFVYKWLIFI
jgi:hypothetical protein